MKKKIPQVIVVTRLKGVSAVARYLGTSPDTLSKVIYDKVTSSPLRARAAKMGVVLPKVIPPHLVPPEPAK